MSEDSHLKDGLIDLTAGTLAGVNSVYVGQPLDTVKVKMQTFPHLYRNMFDCFIKTLKTDGIYKGLYAGTIPALLSSVSENSILFLCYGICQKFVQKLTNTYDVRDLSIINNATAGCLASFFSTLAMCPTEVLKCKLQAMREMQKDNNKPLTIGSTKLMKIIIKQEGFVGFFKGLAPTMVREMPGYFFFFGAYEGARELLRQPGQTKDDIGLLKTMISGSIGGAVLWLSIYPADLVKSRIQIGNTKHGMITVFFKTCRNEGFFALYNGLLPTLIRTVPATATLFVTYEYSKRFMHSYL